MKKMSKEINAVIDKQAKKQQKEVPHFKPNHLSEKLKSIHAEIESTYKQAEDLKYQIQ